MNDNHNQDISPSGTDRVELKVLGISYSQIQSGAYALILAEANGPMRLPVVVGGMEAQSIAIKLEGIIPPRPMTHDLFASLMHAYGLQLMEVYIYKFEDGIFSSELTFIDRTGNEVKLDARTSDAIAISMRTGATIFTTQAILAETGFTMVSISHDGDGQPSTNGPEEIEDEEASNETRLATLRKALAKAIEEEAYEEASRITSEINELENRKQREDE